MQPNAAIVALAICLSACWVTIKDNADAGGTGGTGGGDSCAPADAHGVGACRRLLGYRWTGARCELLDGCACEGAGCSRVVPDATQCEDDHSSCVARARRSVEP